MSTPDTCLIPYLRSFALAYGFDPDSFILGLVDYTVHSPRSFQEVVDEVIGTVVRLSVSGVWEELPNAERTSH